MASVPKKRAKRPSGRTARKTRDYQAEYQRRIELAQQRGQTKAQGRRGARKYAKAELGPRGGVGEQRQRAATTAERYRATPKEVTRQRLAGKVTRKGEVEHDVQTFHSLPAALDFAAQLPARTIAYILARGKHRTGSSRYDPSKHGWAALSGWGAPRYFGSAVGRQAVADREEALFDPAATTYEVRSRPTVMPVR